MMPVRQARRWSRSYSFAAAPLLSAALAACSDHAGEPVPPGFVCVEAERYASSVSVSAPATAKVGEWVTLHASRRSGPWKAVLRDAVVAAQRGFDHCPPSFEPEVSSNLTWHVDPSTASRFDPATAASDADTPRRVLFTAPGTYRLTARSDYPSRAFSNTLTITVR